MLLEHDVAHGEFGAGLVATEVEHDLHAGEVDAWHVGLVEHIVLIGLELDDLVEIEFAIIGLLANLHGHVAMVFRRVEHTREVIVGGGVGGHVGVEEVLALPLVGGCLGQSEGEGTSADRLHGVGNLVPSRSIPISVGIVGGAEHVAIAVVLEALELLLGSGFLGDEDEMPCDGTVVIDQFHVLRLEVYDLELRCVPLVIVGDIGELGVAGQHEEHIVALNGEVIG